MKQISYSREATKTLIKMPANKAKLIRSKIEQYANDPASLTNNVKPLKGGEGLMPCGSVTGASSSQKMAAFSRL